MLLLLEARADLQKLPDDSATNETALRLASGRGHVGVVRALLEARADANAGWHFGPDGDDSADSEPSMLAVAYDEGRRDILKLLLQARADANDGEVEARCKGYLYGGAQPLLYDACTKGDLELARLLLAAAADVGGRPRWCQLDPEDPESSWAWMPQPPRPLCTFSCAGNVVVMQLLLQANADPNEDANECSDDEPALCLACSSGSTEAVRLLLEACADANIPCSETPGFYRHSKDTALCLASRHGNADMVQLLLKARADPNLRADWHPTLSIARERGDVEIVRLLTKSGADCEAADRADAERDRAHAEGRALIESIFGTRLPAVRDVGSDSSESSPDPVKSPCDDPALIPHRLASQVIADTQNRRVGHACEC